MSDNYEDASFENDSNKSKSNGVHHLKLSIDLMSVRNMAVAASVFVSYSLELTDTQTFQSQPPTPVSTGNQDTKL